MLAWRPRPMPLGARTRSELRLRILSAGVLIPLVILATWAGETSFAAIAVIVCGVVHFEWCNMVGGERRRLRQTAGVLALALIAAAALTLTTAGATLVWLASAAAMTLAGLSLGGLARALWSGIGMVYSGAPVLALVVLRQGPDGFGVIVLILLVAWTTDTAAFFTGRRLRGPKLWPAISPAKTWSGAAGGLVFGLAAGLLVATSIGMPVTAGLVGFTAVIAVAAQLGDLFESAVKRRFGIKDTGTLIPGHGGMMDRVDGLIMASAVAGIIALAAGSGGAEPATALVRMLS